MEFYQEILHFVTQAGFTCEETDVNGLMFLRAANVSGETLYILPEAISARSPEEAAEEYRKRSAARKVLQEQCMDRAGSDTDISRHDGGIISSITVAEDRWRKQNRLYRARLLSHLGEFHSIFARNCTVERIDRASANRFMDANHTYGSSACRHCYGLTEKKTGSLVAAATFSNARRWIKDGHEIRSYEWIRYASSSGTRIPGGMGKILKKFIMDIKPDDIMSYADLEWSGGDVYRRLGFIEDGAKEPVLFMINPSDWSRKAFKTIHTGLPAKLPGQSCSASGIPDYGNMLWYMNNGSLKYRLRLTGPHEASAAISTSDQP